MKFISKELNATWFIRIFGLSKVPLIFYCRPSVIKLTEETAVIKIPLKRRNKNHLKSMYFGALDRKSTRLNSSHTDISRMPSSA